MEDGHRRRLPPINAIRVFEAAARLESFTRAGDELGMTQAAVSYQIKLLEERLGFALFRREPRRVTLTPRGRRLSASATEAFRVLEAAFGDAAKAAESVLTISTMPTFSANWLVPRLGAFQVAHPKLAVRVDTTHRLVDLTREDVDVGIRSGDGDWPGHEAKLLFDDSLAALAPAEAVARFGPFTHPRDVLRLRLIGPIDWWRKWFALGGVPDDELPERTTLELESQYAEVSAAISTGDAAAIVSPLYFTRELEAGVLVQPFDHLVPEGKVWVTYDRARRQSPKIRAFVRWVRAEAEAMTAGRASNDATAGLSTPS